MRSIGCLNRSRGAAKIHVIRRMAAGLVYISRRRRWSCWAGRSHISNGRGGPCYQIRLPEDIATDVEPVEPTVRDAVDLSVLHVLLVEDNPLVAEVTKTRLNKIFAKVTLARNGEDALVMAQANPPDLLITDLFMPKMEGDQLIRALKELDHDYVMIGLTAVAVGNDIDRFTDAGADLVMSKPLDSDALIAFLAG